MHRLVRRRAHTMRALGVVLITVGISACSDDDNVVDPGPGPLQAADFQRLVVADGEQNTARIVSMSDGTILQTYSLTGLPSSVYASGSGRFAVIHQRTANRVSFIDGGVWSDNLVGSKRDPVRLTYELNEGLPTHESVNGNWITVFFDGTGRGVYMNESDFVAGTPRASHEIDTGTPHHGGSVTTVIAGSPYLVTSRTDAAGAASGVEVRNAARQVISSVANCPGLHGNGSSANGAVFGCNDGLVIIRQSGGVVAAQKVTTSGDMTGLALRNAYSATGATYILGQFAAFTGQPAQRVLAIIDPSTGTMGRLPALPDGVTDHWRAIEPIRGDIVLLGTNGSLYVYGATTRQLRLTVNNVVPAIAATGALTHQVSVAEGVAAVANPTVSEVVLVDLTNGTIIRRIPVAGKPSRIALLGARRAGSFTAAP
ncbi:MAG: hypothetical protein ACO1Q7_20105 [Gemmatimonas sp.]